MNDSRWRTASPIIIEALDQTWSFSPDVIRVFSMTGLEPEAVMKTIIMDQGTKFGFEDGVYNVSSFGFEIQLTAKDGSVTVEDPYV